MIVRVLCCCLRISYRYRSPHTPQRTTGSTSYRKVSASTQCACYRVHLLINLTWRFQIKFGLSSTSLVNPLKGQLLKMEPRSLHICLGRLNCTIYRFIGFVFLVFHEISVSMKCTYSVWGFQTQFFFGGGGGGLRSTFVTWKKFAFCAENLNIWFQLMKIVKGLNFSFIFNHLSDKCCFRSCSIYTFLMRDKIYFWHRGLFYNAFLVKPQRL